MLNRLMALYRAINKFPTFGPNGVESNINKGSDLNQY